MWWYIAFSIIFTIYAVDLVFLFIASLFAAVTEYFVPPLSTAATKAHKQQLKRSTAQQQQQQAAKSVTTKDVAGGKGDLSIVVDTRAHQVGTGSATVHQQQAFAWFSGISSPSIQQWLGCVIVLEGGCSLSCGHSSCWQLQPAAHSSNARPGAALISGCILRVRVPGRDHSKPARAAVTTGAATAPAGMPLRACAHWLRQVAAAPSTG